MLKRVVKKILKILFLFNPQIDLKLRLTSIGTTYGGYHIYDKNLNKPVIVSCGLGEDASFDIDMINNYNAKIIAIDPTPRSKDYYLELIKNIGKNREKKYDESGKLDINSYDLRKVDKNNFIFLDKAIWSKNEENLKLYFPSNLQHVSLSINTKDQTNFYLAKTISYNKICEAFNLSNIDILKLDIEGAEVEVIKDILDNSKLPNQILVEFDIRRRVNYKNKKILENIHNKLKKFYFLININSKGDFTYILKKNYNNNEK